MSNLKILKNLNVRINQQNILKDIEQAQSKGYKHVFMTHLFDETKKALKELGYRIKYTSRMHKIEWK